MTHVYVCVCVFKGPNSPQNLHLLGPKIVYEVLKVHTPWTLGMTKIKSLFSRKSGILGPGVHTPWTSKMQSNI